MHPRSCRRFRAFLAPTLVLLACACHDSILAATWHVPSEAATIQEGLTLATDGDTVLVACGTYYESAIDFGEKKSIVLLSETGQSDCVVIDAGSAPGIRIAGAENTYQIIGFTVIGASGGTGAQGGLVCDGGSPQITRCVFSGNQSVYMGGGVACTSGTNPIFTDCEFIDNTSPAWGGGMFVDGSSSPVLQDCRFLGNEATGGSGGGIHVRGSSQITLVDCLVSGNAALLDGGGIHSQDGSTVSLTGCTLVGNESISCSGIYLGDLSSGLVMDSTIIAAGLGGAAIGGAVSATLSCSNLYGNEGGDWIGDIAGQLGSDGNICADPMLCDPAAGDFTLHESSPCLDAPGCGQIGAFGLGCGSRNWYVSTSGSDVTGDGTLADPFATLQKALDLCFPADTVQVACGTYLESGIICTTSGIVIRSESGLPDCAVFDAAGDSVGFTFSGVDSTTVLSGITVSGAGDWNLVCGDASPLLTDCAFVDGSSVYVHGVSSPHLVACRFEGNSSEIHAAALYLTMDGETTLSNCSVVDNVGHGAGGIEVRSISTSVPRLNMVDCLLTGNASQTNHAGALYIWYSTVSMTDCTVVGNSGGDGAIYSYTPLSWGSLTLSSTIIAFNQVGKALTSSGNIPVLSCCDLYGNEGGDWIGDIADQLGSNGNISEDPLFCDLANAEYSLRAISPCLYAPACGRIGAPTGTGCDFRIASIADVAPDQGGQVRVRWNPNGNDADGMPYSIESYSLWRRFDPAKSVAAPLPPGMATPKSIPPGDWDFVKVVPAMGLPEYSTICPTLADSTIVDGMHWSSFFVAAHTADPLVYFDSDPDSGYSVDDLAPSAPANLRQSGADLLAWDDPVDADFRYFTVYGSDQEELDESAVVIEQTIETSLDISGLGHSYYHVTATDFSGNEGLPATLWTVSDVPGPRPTQYALHPCVPNPFNPSTTIRFDLPEPTVVRLRIYDVAGRLIRTLLDSVPIEAGCRESVWLGRDDTGHCVAAGVYFYRLEAGAFHETRAMTLVK